MTSRIKGIELPGGYAWGACLHSARTKMVFALEGGETPAVASVCWRIDTRRPPLPALEGLSHVMRPLEAFECRARGVRFRISIFERATPCERVIGQSVDPVRAVLLMLLDISHALVDMERLGVLHNDIKPANILFSEAEGYLLSDFDAATPIGYAGGFRRGTRRFASPEHALGLATGAGSDQYALALCAHRLLSARRPCRVGEWLRLHGRPVRPDPWMAELARALNPDPKDRYPSASAFREAVARLVQRHMRGETDHGQD